MTWPKEDIPDTDELYLRVPRAVIEDDKQIPAGVFRDREGISSDWSRYATPHGTRRRGPQGAENYAVISLVVEIVRNLDPLRVEHSPVDPDANHVIVAMRSGNRAHADILGLATARPSRRTQIRELLWEAHQPRIAVDDPVLDRDDPMAEY